MIAENEDKLYRIYSLFVEGTDPNALLDLYSHHKRLSFLDPSWKDIYPTYLEKLSSQIRKTGDRNLLNILWELRDRYYVEKPDNDLNISDLENTWAKNSKIVLCIDSSPYNILPSHLIITIYEYRHVFSRISFYINDSKGLAIIRNLSKQVRSGIILDFKSITDYLSSNNLVHGLHFDAEYKSESDLLDFILYIPIKNGSFVGLNPCSKVPSFEKPVIRSQQISAVRVSGPAYDGINYFAFSCNYNISDSMLNQLLIHRDDVGCWEILTTFDKTFKPSTFTFSFPKQVGKKDGMVSISYSLDELLWSIEIHGNLQYGKKPTHHFILPIKGNVRRSNQLIMGLIAHVREYGNLSISHVFHKTDWLIELIHGWVKPLFIRGWGKSSPNHKAPLSILEKILGKEYSKNTAESPERWNI